MEGEDSCGCAPLNFANVVAAAMGFSVFVARFRTSMWMTGGGGGGARRQFGISIQYIWWKQHSTLEIIRKQSHRLGDVSDSLEFPTSIALVVLQLGTFHKSDMLRCTIY
jgi:hypothetical protein